MTPIQIQITAAIVTILGSGVIAALVNHLFIKEREDRAAKRKCAEELYLAVDGFAKIFSNFYFQIHTVMHGRQSYDQAHDAIVKDGHTEKDKSYFSKMEMMVALYFPELGGALRRIVDLRGKINETEREFKAQYSGNANRSLADKYCRALEEFEAATQAFKDQIALVVKKLR